MATYHFQVLRGDTAKIAAATIKAGELVLNTDTNRLFVGKADGLGQVIEVGSEVIDLLTSIDATKALSANQGKVLKDLIDALTATVTSGLSYRGAFDASAGTMPGEGTIVNKGDMFRVSVAGTGGSFTNTLNIGDMLIANKPIAANTVATEVDFDFFDNSESADLLKLINISTDVLTPTEATALDTQVASEKAVVKLRVALADEIDALEVFLNIPAVAPAEDRIAMIKQGSTAVTWETRDLDCGVIL